MKSPITGKEMKLVKESRSIEYRKEKFDVVFHFYYCEESSEQFTNDVLDEINTQQVLNQYREMYKIPFPEEIIQIREKYGVSAAKMSEILGLGANGYRNYEAGEMPSLSNANLIRLAAIPKNFREMVSNNEALDEKFQLKLKQKAETLIEEERENLFTSNIKKYLLGNYPANLYSGYRKPSLEKFTEMVVFFAEQMKPFKTRLNKLLFYSDFLMYKQTCFSISGASYKAINLGPVPTNFNSIFEYLANTDEIDIYYKEFNDGMGEQFIAREDRPFKDTVLTKFELQVLQTVAKRFRKESTNKIIETSHLEKAWKKNQKEKTEISYNDAFDLIAL